jgi:hypothetical protein
MKRATHSETQQRKKHSAFAIPNNSNLVTTVYKITEHCYSIIFVLVNLGSAWEIVAPAPSITRPSQVEDDAEFDDASVIDDGEG